MTQNHPLWLGASFVLGVSLTLAFIYRDSLGDDSTLPSCYQSYPNIPGKVVFENNKVVVQRFVFPPGQWEGVHAHPPNQLFIHIKGGHWTSRRGDQIGAGYYPTGSVGWYGPVDLSDDHESMNSGTEPIDLIWVTLKETCTTSKRS